MDLHLIKKIQERIQKLQIDLQLAQLELEMIIEAHQEASVHLFDEVKSSFN